MTITSVMDNHLAAGEETPGLALARLREKRGFSIDAVATQLHLRVKVIELLEADAYDKLPETVFVQGYIRSYAKLLGVSPDPYLKPFIQQDAELKPYRPLQQKKQESYIGERVMRWGTIVFGVILLTGIGFWLQQLTLHDKPHNALATSKQKKIKLSSSSSTDTEINVLTKMRSMFSSEKDSLGDNK